MVPMPVVEKKGHDVFALTKALKSKDVKVRERAVWDLGNAVWNRQNITSVLSTLMEVALRDKSAEVREKATGVIGSAAWWGQKTASALPVLAKGLRDKNAEVRERAAEMLATLTFYGLEITRVERDLIRALGDKNDKVRVSVAKVFARVAYRELERGYGHMMTAVAPLTKAAVDALTKARDKDSNADVRKYAEDALNSYHTWIKMQERLKEPRWKFPSPRSIIPKRR